MEQDNGRVERSLQLCYLLNPRLPEPALIFLTQRLYVYKVTVGDETYKGVLIGHQRDAERTGDDLIAAARIEQQQFPEILFERYVLTPVEGLMYDEGVNEDQLEFFRDIFWIETVEKEGRMRNILRIGWHPIRFDVEAHHGSN